LAGKNVSENTYIVLGGTSNLNSLNQSLKTCFRGRNLKRLGEWNKQKMEQGGGISELPRSKKNH